MLCGCSTTKEQQREQQIVLVNIVSREAAYTTARLVLQKNPDQKPVFTVAAESLDVALAQGKTSSANLREAIAGLPQIKGSTGELLQTAVTLYVVGTGYIVIDDAPLAKAAMEGVRDGLRAATQ
jgi:hypothetical protein